MKLQAPEGKVIVPLDHSDVYGNFIYLGKYDSADNYEFITFEEGEELKAEIEAHYEKQRRQEEENRKMEERIANIEATQGKESADLLRVKLGLDK